MFFTTNREVKKFLFKLIDNANVLFIYLNMKGDIDIVNKKTENITGRRKEQIVGKNWLDILYRNKEGAIKQQMFKAVMDDSIIYKRANNFEGSILDNLNNQRLVSWSITPILTQKNELEGVLLIGNDVTELKEREASLRKIDETLKNIFSNIKEYSLYVVNLDGNITYFGMGSENMFGWQKNEIIFKHVSALHKEKGVNPELESILDEVKRYGICEIETELVKKDGVTFPVILTVSRFLDNDGNLTGYIFIAKDITERKKLEYQIFQAEKLSAIGQLAAGMAHEINNPLFVISGRLEMILEDDKLQKEFKDNLLTINSQADRIRKLVDRMLKFARNTPPNLEPLDVNEVIEGVLPLISYHKLPPASQVEIDKEFAKDLPKIRGDLNQLQEVFVNLLLNAYQAMPEGGRLTIRTINFENSHVLILISDSGLGIPAQNLKNLFMPFFSTKRDGTGLGLSICYNIIKNHNGSIEVESQDNKGTTFIIKLPFTQEGG